MRFSWLRWLPALALFYWSGEILVRRWIWHQLPTQVSPLVVYSLLAINACLLVTLRPRVSKGSSYLLIRS